MSAAKRQMHLGVFVLGTGNHSAGWRYEGAADGFNILPPYVPGGFADFVDLVVPELTRRGLFRRNYEGTTLRDHFGLARVPTPIARQEAIGAE